MVSGLRRSISQKYLKCFIGLLKNLRAQDWDCILLRRRSTNSTEKLRLALLSAKVRPFDCKFVCSKKFALKVNHGTRVIRLTRNILFIFTANSQWPRIRSRVILSKNPRGKKRQKANPSRGSVSSFLKTRDFLLLLASF